MLLDELIGDSAGITAVRDQVDRLVGRRAAGRRLPHLLLTGETGTGKGLVARALHGVSPRRSGPFVDVNCAAIPENLLEAELFGVERGAYTGADRSRPGLFQAAHQGTLFLDEIALVSIAVQGKLLKALEERTVRRVGSTRSESVDAWILAATNEDLEEAMRTGRFRRDLYHRLAVVTLRLPPLRERGADVIRLAEHFLVRASADYGLPPRTLSEDARATLRAYSWPGNVRELANIVERVALLSDASLVTPAMLDLPVAPQGEHQEPGDPRKGLRAVVGATERERLLEALEATGWNLSRAAARLQVPRNTLRYRMERHGLREPPPSRRPPEARVDAVAERRRLSLLRVALVTPSAEGAAAHTGRVLDAVVQKVQAFGGRVEELAPAAVVAAFGLEPVEDAPRRAALAAIAAEKAVERIPHDELAVSIVAAIHVHECGLTRSASGVELDRDSRGLTWPVLEALAEAARPRGVVASEAAAASLRRRFDLGPAIAGGGEVGRAHRLTGAEQTAFGPAERMTAFVGRGQELALLQSRLGSLGGGYGQVVAIIGEAGIGKSRLLLELRRRLPADGVTYLEGRCVSYGTTTPYLVALDIVRAASGIMETDGLPAAAAKLQALLSTVGIPDDPASHLLALLGGEEPEERLREVNPALTKVRTFDALRHLVIALARRRPMVLAIEDLHWIDKTSDELLGSLIEAIRGVPALIVVTYRPGYEPAWLARAHVTQLSLPPLSADESCVVIRSAFGSEPVAPEVVDMILARGEGNPFFLEELAHALRDEVDAGDLLTVPETVHAVVAARIDRLGAGERRLLQAAAVIGRDVPAVALEAIAGEDPVTLRASLRQLQAADFLLETRLGEHAEYTFKHALTQAVAYGTLTAEQRRDLHGKVARLEHRPEVVARHLTAADLTEEAIPHWLEAGRGAIRRSANVEAVSHLTTAIELLLRRPGTLARDRTELELQLTLGPALVMTRGYAAAEVEAVYRRARTLCEQLGDSPELFSALWGIWLFHLIRDDLRAAQATGERLLGVASRNPDLLVEAHLAIGIPLIYRGHLADGRRHVEESLALYDPERHSDHAFLYGQDPVVAGRGFLSWTLILQDHESDALVSVDMALRRADVIDHASSRAVALFFAALVSDFRGDFTQTLRYAERLIMLADERRFPFWRSSGMSLRGRALAAHGRHADGLELMAAGLESSRSAGGMVTHSLRNIADAYRAVGSVEQALAAIAEGLAVGERNDHRSVEPELYRIRGELLAGNPATSPQAEAAFRRAVAVALEQGSLLFARRAATAFAAYLRERGRVAEAEQVLAEAMQMP